jgi:hypothetical protein
MKRRNRPPDTLRNKNSLSSRRSIADKTIINFLAATTLLVGGIMKVTEPKYPSAPSTASVNFNNAPRNFPELIRILEAEFGYDFQITYKKDQNNTETGNDYGIHSNHAGLGIASPQNNAETDNDKSENDRNNELCLGIISRELAGKAFDTLQSLWNDRDRTLMELAYNFHYASEYTENYQLSEEEMATMDPEEFDCNDHARRACQRLERHGIPMYYLSIWPRDPSLRLDEDSHQMAVCKLQENEYLICDNNNIIFWSGSPSAFARQYHDDYPKEAKMGIMAVIGISKYWEPDDESAYTKAKTHYLLRTTVDKMCPINIPIKPPAAKTGDLL